jgi:hypothetical protein
MWRPQPPQLGSWLEVAVQPPLDWGFLAWCPHGQSRLLLPGEEGPGMSRTGAEPI